jgi:hypothetical protein
MTVMDCPNNCKDRWSELIGDRLACGVCGFWLVQADPEVDEYGYADGGPLDDE